VLQSGGDTLSSFYKMFWWGRAMSVGGSQAHAWIRHRNRALVLSLIRRGVRVSRTDIAISSHLSVPTISQITQALIQEGMIEEIAVGQSRGGRRPALLAIRPNYGWVVGMKVFSETIDVAVTNYLGELIASREVQTSTSDIQHVIATMKDVVASFSVPAMGIPGACLGVGIGIPGTVSQSTGLIRNCPLGWREVNFREQLSKALGLPVMIDNDVNVLAQGHLLFGHAQGRQNVIVITLGRGFGLGIIARGEVYRGTDGAAAEVGHIPWRPTALRCDCGRNDCIENVVTDRFALFRYGELARSSEPLSIEALRERSVKGDPLAVQVFEEIGVEVAKAIAMLVRTFAPELVILSGEGLAAGPALTQTIVGQCDQYGIGTPNASMEWCLDSWDNFHWARSAVSLVFDELIFPEVVRSLNLG